MARPAAPAPPNGPSTAAAAALRTQHRAEALASRLPPLLVAAERVASTVAQGVHGRRRVGTGETFWQFRRYAAGDSAQRIDWRQSAKTQAVFVRETEWEAAQSVWLWRDRSGSMNWRSDDRLPTKRERAELLLLALAVLLVRGGERFALLGEGRLPSGNTVALGRAALVLQGNDLPDGDLPPPVPLPRNGTCVVFGDLLSPLDEFGERLQFLARSGVRGCLVQVLDPAEEMLPYDGRIEFRGLQGEDVLLVPRVEALREAYQRRIMAQREGLTALARAAGWQFLTHWTDHPPQMALLSLWGALAMEAV